MESNNNNFIMVTYHKHGHGLSQSVGWIGLGPKNLGLTFDWVGLGAMLLFYFIMTSQKSQVEVDDHAPSAKNAMVHMQSPVADPEFSNRGCPPPQCGWGLERGLCPLTRNFLEFLYKNGEFWCILGSN